MYLLMLIRPINVFFKSIFAITLLFGFKAYAAPVTWTISNSAHLQGSFNYDADSNTYSDFNVTSLQTNIDFSQSVTGIDLGTLELIVEPSQPGGTSIMVLVQVNEFVGFNQSTAEFDCSLLTIKFASPITNNGGDVVIESSQEDAYSDFNCISTSNTYFFDEGQISSSQISQVDVPMPLWAVVILAVIIYMLGRNYLLKL